MKQVFENIDFSGIPPFENSPIITTGEFNAGNGKTEIIVTPLYILDPDPPEGEPRGKISLSDFILSISPNN